MSIHEIRVIALGDDPVGHEVLGEIERTIGVDGLEEVRTSKVYRLEGISDEEADLLAGKVLSDPISEATAIDEVSDYGTDHVIEVAYKPGVMNPEAESLMKAAHDLDIHPVAADSSREYAFIGNISPTLVIDTVAGRLLVNDTVEHVVKEKPDTLIVEGDVGPITVVPIREASDEQLMELSKDKLFMNLDEMKAIQGHFQSLGRDPKDAELEHIAGAAWSEHCGHKTFNADIIFEDEAGNVEMLPPLYRQIKDGSKAHPNYERLVVSAFHDNSGVMKFYDGQAICGKVETHNSPSAVEPYGGAMTGSGGVFRDIVGTGQGAKTIISTDMFCFGPPTMTDDELKPRTLHPDYMQRQVIRGVRDYGNRMGIPTANGSIHYHKDFQPKPTVIVGAYGILPESQAQKGEPHVGDLVVTVGGRTGRDGIHGANFSSGEMTERTANVNSSAVQIGNAIEEKRVFDALLEARDRGYIRALTDCGAAGFASAIGEIGESTGVTVDISKAPLKYEGMAPWEVWISESQERMVIAISPENADDFMKLCSKYNVEATTLGVFDGSNTLTVNYGEENLIELDYEFLQNGLPNRTMQAKWERPNMAEIKPEKPTTPEEWIERVKAVLSHGNVASKEQVVRQYDQGVQGGNVVSPYGGVTQEGPNDALVVRPILGSPYGVVQSHGMNPILNRIDPYKGTVWAIAEAAANYVSAGGDINEAVSVGNYIWPSPDQDSMGSLVLSTRAVCDMMALGMPPVISGKDSLSSTYTRRDESGEVIDQVKIPPVYADSIFGRIPDVEKTMTTDIKKPGKSSLYLVGYTSENMGGSTYYEVAGGESGKVPGVYMEGLPHVLSGVTSAIQNGDVLACHDVSEGGLMAAVSEMCFGGGSGAVIQMKGMQDPETFLFNETAGCFVLEIDDRVDPYNLFKRIPVQRVGYTTEDERIVVRHNWQTDFDVSNDELKAAWQAPMKEVFHD